MKLFLGPFFFSFEISVATWTWDQRGPVANAFSETGACKDLAERGSEEVESLRPLSLGPGKSLELQSLPVAGSFRGSQPTTQVEATVLWF